MIIGIRSKVIPAAMGQYYKGTSLQSQDISKCFCTGRIAGGSNCCKFCNTCSRWKKQSGGPLLIISQALCKSDQSDQIVFGQIFGQLFQFANQLRFFDVGIEEFLGGDTEIIAKTKKFGEGRQGFAGGDALIIAFAMAQIQAHLVFRNAFFVRSSEIRFLTNRSSIMTPPCIIE